MGRGNAGAVAFIVWLALTACGDDGPPEPDAGWGAGDSPPSVQPVDPILVIGADETKPDQLFHGIRGLFHTADNRIVVGNNATSQIRVFDSTGALITEMGAPGAGPDEFQSLEALLPFKDDSIAAWDPLTQRISIWSLDGTRGRTIRFQSGSPPQLEAGMDDGRFVLATERRTTPIRVPWATWQDSLEISLLDIERESEVEHLARLPNVTIVAAQIPSGRLIGAPIPESTGLLIDAQGEHILLGIPDSARIAVLDPSGHRVNEIDLAVQPRSRSADAVEAWIEGALSDVSDEQRGGIRRYLGEYPQPERFPAFDQMLVDVQGRIWVRRYVAPGDPISRLARVTADGEVAGEVALPPDFKPTQIGEDWILGSLAGENDEELVALFPFDQP